MAFELRLYLSKPTELGTTTLDLSSYVQFYTPATAPDGVDRVTEQVQIRLPAGLTAARADLRTLEDFLRRAKAADQLQLVPRPWIEFTPDSDENTYIAQLFGGSLQPTDSILSKGQLNAEIFDFIVTWEREAVWTAEEDESLVFYSSDDYDGTGYNNDSNNWFIYNSADRITITAEVLAAANGVLTAFSGTVASPTPNVYHSRSTPTFKYTIAAVNYSYTYDQLKSLPSGTTKVTVFTFNFLTGAWALTFSSPPDNATNITIDYINGYGNWVQMDGGSGAGFAIKPYTILGDIPALPVISMTNDGSDDMDDLWIGCYQAIQRDAYPELWYEAEDAGSIETSGAIQGDASLSGGSQVAWTVTTTESVLLDWTITADNIKLMAGKWFAPIIRFGKDQTSNISSILLRWQLYTDDDLGARSQLVFETDQYQPAANSKLMHQVGLVQLPPWPLSNFPVLDTSFNGAQMHLVLTCQAIGTSRGVTIDAIQLMPTDFFTKIEYQGGSIAASGVLTYDGYDRTLTYVPSGSTNRNRAITLLHDYPTIDPTRDQRWYFLWTDSGSYVAPFAWDINIGVSYYPRRRVI